MYYLDYQDNEGFNYQEDFESWIEAHENATQLKKSGYCNFIISHIE